MRTVLVVDDCPVARHVVARRLTAEGFDVREASSSGAALVLTNGYAEADHGTLSCAIVDLELGDGDGTDFVAALLDRDARLPVAFFTAGANASTLARARSQGPVFDKNDVDALIAWALHARR